MPVKKVDATKTVDQKGNKPVEEAKESTTAKAKTAAKTKTTTKKTTTAKKTSTKKTTAKTDKVAVEVKPEETVKTKTAVKKAKATPVKTSEEKKPAAKKAPAKKAATKKTPAKKTAATKEPAKKTTVKKTVTKKAKPKVDEEALKALKLDQYNHFSLDTCIDMARAMGVNLGYDQYANWLLEEADEAKIVEVILAENGITSDKFSYEEDGYDADLIPILVKKVSETVDIKAKDFDKLGEEVITHQGYVFSDEILANNDEYHAQFDLMRRLLIIAQRKDLHTMEALKELIKVDATEFVSKFMEIAYNVLKNWQYDDVKYYENFIYTVLSQFDDLYDQYETKAMMDVADLYIEHGDYGLGDANYNYILRENQIKDLIYFRFANVYKDIDREKCRAIANDALQYVDGRYTYYPNIIQLLEN